MGGAGTHARGWPRPCPLCQNDSERGSRHLAGNLSPSHCPSPCGSPWGPAAPPASPAPESCLPQPPPLSLPWTRAHSKHPPSVALAWPGLSVLPPAGGEGRSLQQQQQLGLWVIAGFLTFLALEKMFLDSKEQEESSQVSPEPQNLVTSASVVWWCQGLEAQVLS